MRTKFDIYVFIAKMYPFAKFQFVGGCVQMLIFLFDEGGKKFCLSVECIVFVKLEVKGY
jgi:hypothetical protein